MAHTIPRRSPFVVVFEHDGIDTDSYELWLNGERHGAKDRGADIEFEFVEGLLPGRNVFIGKAIGEAGIVESDPYILDVAPPKLPSKPVILVFKIQGEVRVEITEGA